jgi:hypothetical protein
MTLALILNVSDVHVLISLTDINGWRPLSFCPKAEWQKEMRSKRQIFERYPETNDLSIPEGKESLGVWIASLQHLIDQGDCKNTQQEPTQKALDHANIPGDTVRRNIPESKCNKGVEA